jgi:2-dehydropantoate 2-reductase
MGCLWATALAQNTPVCLLLKNAAALSQYPGYIRHQFSSGQQLDTELPAALASSLAPGSIQRLLLCCKAQDAAAAINSVAHALTPESVIVLLQNGFAFQQELTAKRPPATVFCLSTSAGAWLRAPFVISPAGQGQSWLGHLNTDHQTLCDQRANELLAELPAQAMNIVFEPAMTTRLWQKLAVNCAINALTVVHDCHNGELLTRPEAFIQLQALTEEIIRLYAQLPQTPELPHLQQTVQAVAAGTAENISSTLQDVRRGRQTEIDHLNGFLVHLAQQHNLPCPLNLKVLQAVHARIRGVNLKRNPPPCQM